MLITSSIYQEDITTINIYVPNIPQIVKQTLTELKEEIDSSKIIVGDQYLAFNNG